GAMIVSASKEIIVKTYANEDLIATFEDCGYAANLEKATSYVSKVQDQPSASAPEEFPTPGVRTIEDLVTFPGGAPRERQIKTLVYVAQVNADSKVAHHPYTLGIEANSTQSLYVLALLRGDHQLQETKLADAIGATEVRPAHPEEIRDLLGASAGSLGGVNAVEKAREAGQNLFIVVDTALEGRRNMTTGANKDD